MRRSLAEFRQARTDFELPATVLNEDKANILMLLDRAYDAAANRREPDPSDPVAANASLVPTHEIIAREVGVFPESAAARRRGGYYDITVSLPVTTRITSQKINELQGVDVNRVTDIGVHFYKGRLILQCHLYSVTAMPPAQEISRVLIATHFTPLDTPEPTASEEKKTFLDRIYSQFNRQ